MATAAPNLKIVADTGNAYFFERIRVEESMLLSLISGLDITKTNFLQVSRVYETISVMERECKDHLERIDAPYMKDPVNKLVVINLCDDMLHSADKEIAVVKTILSRTATLIKECESCLKQYDNSRMKLTQEEIENLEESVKEILFKADKAADDVRKQLASVRRIYNETSLQWADRIKIRSELFDNIALAKRNLDNQK